MPAQTKVGRPYPTSTPLGKIMWYGDWRVYDLGAAAGISPRTLTEYLAGRLEISSQNLVKLSQALGCLPKHLVDSSDDTRASNVS